MNPASIPVADYVLTILAAVAVAVVLTVLAAWLIDHALLPAVRGLVPAGWAARRWPAQGKHKKHKESSAQLEVGRPGPADHREPAPPRPDRGGVPAGPTPDIGPGPGRSDQHGDPAVSHRGEPGDWRPLDGDYDTDTLRVFSELNAGHPVPAHEPPDASAPAGLAGPLDAGDAGEAAGAEAPPRPDQLDALIEQYRQHTIADPRLGDWIRDALGADSVRSYMERMEASLRTATA